VVQLLFSIHLILGLALKEVFYFRFYPGFLEEWQRIEGLWLVPNMTGSGLCNFK